MLDTAVLVILDLNSNLTLHTFQRTDLFWRGAIFFVCAQPVNHAEAVRNALKHVAKVMRMLTSPEVRCHGLWQHKIACVSTMPIP